MTQFTRPLVALSLTEPDASLLQYAGRLSELFAWNDLHFAHVAAADRRDDWDPRPLEQKMQAEVARHTGEHFSAARGNAAYHAARGSRIDQLLRVAVEHQRDLILLGHRRMRSGRRSLARRAAMVAPCSVWLAPEDSRPQITNILVPTDFSSHSSDALAVAIDIARAAGLNQVRLLHVFFDPSSVRFDEHLDEVLGNEEAEFERFLAGVQTHGVAVEPMFHESTHPPEAILRVVQQTETDLIVMNTRGRSQAASVLLGSTTSDVISGTSVPLLAVKHYGSKMTLLQALLNHRIWEEQTPKSN